MALALCPLLGKQEPGLDGLSEPNLISQDGSLREGAPKRKDGRFNLVGVQIHLGLGIRQNRGELLHAVRRAAAGELVGQVFGVVIRHRFFLSRNQARSRTSQ